MPVDEYWHGDPRLLANYVEAKRRSINDAQYISWLNGVYIRHAMATTVSLSIPILGKVPTLPDYPEPPVEQEKPREPTETEKMKFRMELYMHYKSLCKGGGD